MLQPGDVAPDFTAVDDEGNTVTLSQFRGRPVVLYFYPKDNTPGCTAEACRFRDHHPQFEAAGAVVLGVSPDSVASHRRFRARHRLPFRLLADPQRKVAEAYGVVSRNPVGRLLGLVDRTTFVIDPEGRIHTIIRGMLPDHHVDQALKSLTAQGSGSAGRPASPPGSASHTQR
ncbi:MAG: peroxiredoxin [Thermaerobacter sp.]|nr:peroxiredoxin [Bacillota bacterium]REJ38105.1 MAG: peroxiredoxin [Bacillota bacterium]